MNLKFSLEEKLVLPDLIQYFSLQDYPIIIEKLESDKKWINNINFMNFISFYNKDVKFSHLPEINNHNIQGISNFLEDINFIKEENINCFLYNFSSILTVYFLYQIIRETEAELLKKINLYNNMNFQKYSFIGKIDKVSSDFNLYFEKLEAFKNIENDPNQLLTPEYYLQSIINRKRPETAIPCNVRNNRRNSFDEDVLKQKSHRVKTSTNKRESLIGNSEMNNEINLINQNNFYSNFNNDNSDIEIGPNFIDNNNHIGNVDRFQGRFNAQINNQIKNLDNSKTRQILNNIRRQDSRRKNNEYGFKNIGSESGLFPMESNENEIQQQMNFFEADFNFKKNGKKNNQIQENRRIPLIVKNNYDQNEMKIKKIPTKDVNFGLENLNFDDQKLYFNNKQKTSFINNEFENNIKKYKLRSQTDLIAQNSKGFNTRNNNDKNQIIDQEKNEFKEFQYNINNLNSNLIKPQYFINSQNTNITQSLSGNNYIPLKVAKYDKQTILKNDLRNKNFTEDQKIEQNFYENNEENFTTSRKNTSATRNINIQKQINNNYYKEYNEDLVMSQAYKINENSNINLTNKVWPKSRTFLSIISKMFNENLINEYQRGLLKEMIMDHNQNLNSILDEYEVDCDSVKLYDSIVRLADLSDKKL